MKATDPDPDPATRPARAPSPERLAAVLARLGIAPDAESRLRRLELAVAEVALALSREIDARAVQDAANLKALDALERRIVETDDRLADALNPMAREPAPARRRRGTLRLLTPPAGDEGAQS